MRSSLLFLVLAAACGVSDSDPPDIELQLGPGEIPCGDTTCGADEYCVNQCDCCGDGSGPLRSHTECRPLPVTCNSEDICECDGIYGSCNADTRSVDIPCA